MNRSTATLIAAPGAAAAAALGWSALRNRRRLRRAWFAQASESELLADHLQAQDLHIDWRAHDLGYLSDAAVLVVGGGGTIGGRLARELGPVGDRRLVLADSDEDGLYRARRRLLELGHRPESLFLELVDVRDRAGVDRLFRTHRPTVVFHYANYKSAAIGELAARAFVQVNVAGLSNLLNAARRERSLAALVYISSDKAEQPTTVYGRTKRVCELLIRASADAAAEAAATAAPVPAAPAEVNGRAGAQVAPPPPVRYASIRYCNVLDAAGSFAIPTFRSQILAGRPVTLRRLPDGSVPDRYFIDIGTAAGAALVAGARAARGEVFSLDPDRIAPIRMDEVVRLIARASGVRHPRGWYSRNVSHVPATAGEKRSELLGHGEPVPGAPLIELAAPAPADRAAFLAAVEELVAACEQAGDERPARLLSDVLRLHDPAQHPVGPQAELVGAEGSAGPRSHGAGDALA